MVTVTEGNECCNRAGNCGMKLCDSKKGRSQNVLETDLNCWNDTQHYTAVPLEHKINHPFTDLKYFSDLTNPLKVKMSLAFGFSNITFLVDQKMLWETCKNYPKQELMWQEGREAYHATQKDHDSLVPAFIQDVICWVLEDGQGMHMPNCLTTYSDSSKYAWKDSIDLPPFQEQCYNCPDCQIWDINLYTPHLGK